jgi:hypothetical protein
VSLPVNVVATQVDAELTEEAVDEAMYDELVTVMLA